jgi:hypothetical protein
LKNASKTYKKKQMRCRNKKMGMPNQTSLTQKGKVLAIWETCLKISKKSHKRKKLMPKDKMMKILLRNFSATWEDLTKI